MTEKGDFDPRVGGMKGYHGPKWLRRLIREDPFDRNDGNDVTDSPQDVSDPRAAGLKGRRGPKWLTNLTRTDPFDPDEKS